MRTLKIIWNFLFIVLVVDFVGFMYWVMMGQTPLDNFFIGSITTNIIRSIIF